MEGREFDLGVEWAEFRTVNTLAVRFAAEDKAPRRGNLLIDYWEGITSRQGQWRTLEENTILGIPLEEAAEPGPTSSRNGELAG